MEGKRTRANAFLAVAVVAMGLVASTGVADDSAAVSPERKLVQELYGARMSQARATRDDADDVELAEQLLTAGRDPANPEGLRLALAMEALEIALPLGTGKSTAAAGDALDLANSIKPMSEPARLSFRTKIALTRYRNATRAGETAETRTELARDAIDRLIEYADVLNDDEQLRAARDELFRAQQMVSLHKLDDIRPALSGKIRQVTAAINYRGQIVRAEQILAEAEQRKDESAIRANRQRLALLHLQYDGDLAQAAKYIDGTDHPNARSVVRAAAFMTAPKSLTTDLLLAVPENLLPLVDSLKDKARRRVAQVCMDMVRAFLDSKPEGIAAARAALVRTRLETILTALKKSNFLDELNKAYGSLACKVTVLDEKTGRIRASYSFSGADELKDFTTTGNAQWAVTQGALVGLAPRGSYAESKLVFQADKPFKISFLAKGDSNLGAIVFSSGSLPFVSGARGVFVTMGDARNQRSSIVMPGVRPYTDARLRVRPGYAHDIELAWDGTDTLTWTVDDKKITDYKIGPRLLQKYVRVALRIVAGPTAYDDLTFEGTVVTDPAGATAAPAPPQAQQRPQPAPPAPRGGPRQPNRPRQPRVRGR